MENKYKNIKKNISKKNILNIDINKDYQNKINKKEIKKIYSYDKNNISPYLSDIKFKNVKNQLETELNNLFKNLPEDFEKYPELKNYINVIVQNIHGLKDYIYKNTQESPKRTKNNINKIKK